MAYDIAFQAKIVPAITSSIASALGTIYDDRVYAIVAPPTATFPLMIYNIRDGSGRRNDTLGANGWEGEMVFRSVSTTLADATDKLVSACELMNTLTATGYTIQVTLNTPQVFPVERAANGILYTVGVIARVRVNQS
jgi:hypothetical protein